MTLRSSIIKLHWVLSSQFGLDPRRFLRSLRGLPRYLKDYRKFRRSHSGVVNLVPCLHDWFEEGGTTRSEYFWQDLLVARWIYEARPQKHVDVGSRVDGFVAHVASFREIEVLDVRRITTNIPGIVFRQADLMQDISIEDSILLGCCDSLSCLHALEHFGLGRYGDPVDPQGHAKGITNMAALLSPGGTLYLSTPIGRERIEFNANRVFDPRGIISLAKACSLEIRSLTVIGPGGNVRHVEPVVELLGELAEAPYNLGILTFRKRVESMRHA